MVAGPVAPVRFQVVLQVAEVRQVSFVFGYDLAIEQCLPTPSLPTAATHARF
jgi:hypothetical protein